jgi:hypothetical protein
LVRLPFWQLLVGGRAPSDRLIAVSEATKSDLLSYYQVPAKSAVVEHGVDNHFFAIAGEVPTSSLPALHDVASS